MLSCVRPGAPVSVLQRVFSCFSYGVLWMIIGCTMASTPEEQARQTIDALLNAAGWMVQDRKDANPAAGRGVAIREFPLKAGFGEADYLLYVDGAAANLPDPDIIASEIAEDLQAALDQFAQIAAELRK